MSLRSRITLVVLALLAVGLLASATVTSTILRRELTRRTDAQLREVEPLATARLRRQDQTATTAGAGPDSGSILVARIDASGQVLDRIVPPLTERSGVLDVVPPALLASARAGHPQVTDVRLDHARYRMLVRGIGRDGDVMAVVAPLRDLDNTMARLRDVELAVGGGVVALASLAAWWLVGVALHPLHEVTDTATAIAGGDVARRIGIGPARRGEVPRLAHAVDQAFDARQRADDKLRRFVTDASHELRSPLTAIRGYAELLRTGALLGPDERHRAVDRVEREAIRMSGLVDDLLLLARLEEGRPPTLGPVDLTAVARDVVADANAAGPAWPVALGVVEPITLVGDEDGIRQILTALLANVRVHCPTGTAATVSVVDRGRVVVEVADDGPGFAAEDTPYVFDRFWRSDPARTRGRDRERGSGLGLSIVAAIAGAHGGIASARNGPDGGAVVRVELPTGRSSTSHLVGLR